MGGRGPSPDTAGLAAESRLCRWAGAGRPAAAQAEWRRVTRSLPSPGHSPERRGRGRRGRRGGACHLKSPAQGRHGPRCVCNGGRESTARLPPPRNSHLSASSSGGLPVPFFSRRPHLARRPWAGRHRGRKERPSGRVLRGGAGGALAGTRGSRRC